MRRLALALATLLLIPFALPLWAQSGDAPGTLAGLQAFRDQTLQQLDTLREKRRMQDELEASLLGGNDVFVIPLRIPRRVDDTPGSPEVMARVDVMVDRATALRFWTIEYLDILAETGASFVSAEFEAFLKDKRDITPDLRRGFARDRAEMDVLEKRLLADLARLEQQIADMQQAAAQSAQAGGSGGTAPDPGTPRTAPGRDDCKDLVGVQRLYGMGEAASVEPGAAVHRVSESGIHEGRRIDILLTWTAPPQRICSGDEIVIEMTATNNAPMTGALWTTVAFVSFRNSRDFVDSITCSNTNGLGPSDHSAAVPPDQSSHVNTCAYRIGTIRRSETAGGMFEVNLDGTPGFGKVTYLYR